MTKKLFCTGNNPLSAQKPRRNDGALGSRFVLCLGVVALAAAVQAAHFPEAAAALGVYFYYGNPIFTVVYYLWRLSRPHLTDKGAFDDVRAYLPSQ